MKTAPPYPEGKNLLAGKTVLITAAAGAGIGGSAAKRCLEEGAKAVYIADMHPRRTPESVEKLRELGLGQVDGGLCDVTKQEDVDNMFQDAIQKMGHIDIVINNAGLGGSVELHEMTDDQWMKVLDVSLNGCFRVTRAALQHMYKRESGVIVNNASVLGWRAQKEQAHYAAAKAGVMALTRCAALEAAERNVRVNAVAPSLAMHPFLVKVTSDELLKELTDQEAFRRYAEPWEVANAMIFLASDLSSYMTGEILSVSSQRA